MIQPRHISNVLSRGLRPVSVVGKTQKCSPLSVSLVSSTGTPLSSVCNKAQQNNDFISIDNLKIYCLLAVNTFNQTQQENGNDSNTWTKIILEKGLNSILESVPRQGEGTESKVGNEVYVLILYDDSVPDAVAKLKVDNICKALGEGLKDLRVD